MSNFLKESYGLRVLVLSICGWNLEGTSLSLAVLGVQTVLQAMFGGFKSFDGSEAPIPPSTKFRM